MATNKPKKQAKKLTLEGLHLWEIVVEYKGWLNRLDHKTLIIATRSNSIAQAVRKATAYIRKNFDGSTRAKIKMKVYAEITSHDSARPDYPQWVGIASKILTSLSAFKIAGYGLPHGVTSI